MMKWKTELILNGLKIVSMKIEHMLFIDSASYLPAPLRKLPEAFGVTVAKSWYLHFFNTNANLDYVGPFPDMSRFGANEMSQSERREFMTCMRVKRTRFLITDISWNSIVRMTSPLSDRRVRYSDGSLSRSATSRFSSSPSSPPHVTRF